MSEDPSTYVRACIAVCCFGGLISTLEFFRVLPAFAPDGLYSWRIIGCEQISRMGLIRFARPLECFGTVGMANTLLAVRLVGFCALPFIPEASPFFAIAAGTLCVSTLLFTWRRYIGDDGSDQMTTIIIATVALSVGPGRGPLAMSIGLWFIAFQACLSYIAAGVAKACSPEWRDGSAIFKVFNTETYGLKGVAGLLRRFPAAGVLAAWSVIVVECVFPVVVLAPAPIAYVLLALGLMFHLSCAIIMGLNSFLWAFAATYPALVFTQHCVRGALGLD